MAIQASLSSHPRAETFPPGEQSCVVTNPDSKAAAVEAFRAVTLHVLVDAFDLRWEEASVVGFRLDEILAPLLVHTPGAIPWAVRREMLEHTYSRLLARRQTMTASAASGPRSEALQASAEDWAETLLAPVFLSYGLTPVQESRMHIEVRDLLAQLGVGDHRNPRPTLYLPADLRQRLSARS